VLLPLYAVNQDKATARVHRHRRCENGVVRVFASDRATTMRLLADPSSVADDSPPGHVVPLRAKTAGVCVARPHRGLRDLARLGGLRPAGATLRRSSCQKDEWRDGA